MTAYYFASRLSLASVLAICMTTTACAADGVSQQPRQLAKQELENIVRARWARENDSNRRQSTTTWNNDPQVRCVSLPMYPSPDQSSQSQNPLSWHIAFMADGTLRDERVRQLKQLDTLVKAGLLQKTTIELGTNGARAKAIQYGLTRAGWRMSTTDRSSFCFMYGASRWQGISISDPVSDPGQAGLAVYTVRIKLGIPENELEEWTRSEDVQVVFPEIERMAQGNESRLQYIRRDHGWIPYTCLQLGTMRRDYAQMCDPQVHTDDSRSMAARGTGMPPEGLLLKKERFLQQVETALLKDLDQFPADKRIQIKQDAFGQINDLKNFPGPTEEEIKNLIRRNNGWEGGTTDFIAFKLYFANEYRFKYRILVSLKLPYDRHIDPTVLAVRKDLIQGKACIGDFGFDVKSRNSHSGSGSCWDAVDNSTPPLQEFSIGKGAPLAAPLTLEDAVEQGLLRKAENKDADAWVQAVMNTPQKRDGLPNTTQSLAIPPRPSMIKPYVVLKDFIYPPELYEGNSATFFIPKGVPAPIGNPGHSSIYDFTALQCRGTTCARE